MNVVSISINAVLFLNIIFSIFVIFREKKDASSTWAWLLVLSLIPVVGFILYLMLGQNLSRSHMFQWSGKAQLGKSEMAKVQEKQLNDGTFPFDNKVAESHKDLIYMLLNSNESVLSPNNEVKIFTDGIDKFDSLIEDIRKARHFIHMQYYIINNDNLAKRVVAELTKKAEQGVKVRVLYDELGSRRIRKKLFEELVAAGGEVEVFFPSKFHLINLRINYRNHRKLVIIDSKVGYVGGFNIGDEYLGLDPKFGYWRDTHLRIVGPAVYDMQIRFILDWNQASHRHDIPYDPALFRPYESTGKSEIQIVTSGPDSEWEEIKEGYIKLILSAKRSIMIQSPYFIPDASLMESLRIACLSGKDVSIMIPDKPDHMFVYWATLSNMADLLKAGAKVYIYRNGFIHAKTIVIDGEVASVGTANIDVRSFRLNFEVTAFVYDEEVALKLEEAFRNDINHSKMLTLDAYNNRSWYIKFKEAISRLLSPIL
ncbi:MAG: cardiolipin synthase [Bacillus sp. (in: firmicutes)]